MIFNLIFYVIEIKKTMFRRYFLSNDGGKTTKMADMKLFRFGEAEKYLEEKNIKGKIYHIDPITMRIRE